jgi:cellulose synthase/poly-beta-1,6-N-acetylglucosamine synthase-like glycosyltransferase
MRRKLSPRCATADEALEDQPVTVLAASAFALSLACLLTFFAIGPLLVWAAGFFGGRLRIAKEEIRPLVSVIVVCRNAGPLLEAKLANLRALEYPRDKYEIIVYSDGSTDGTESVAKGFRNAGVRLVSSTEHRGKNHGLNQAEAVARGEILLFTDVDAKIDASALLTLVPFFADQRVGGVCGDKVLFQDDVDMAGAQITYNSFANGIKGLETRIGSITSNDGTLFAMRKALFRQVPPAVTDDLFLCLAVVGQGALFLFEPRARAFIKAPSTSIAHELARRQRIVNQDLRSVVANAALLNPLRHGGYALRLAVNKVIRRLVPVALLLLFVSSAALAPRNPAVGALFLLQSGWYFLALLHLIFPRPEQGRSLLARLAALAFYFSLGNYGALLGLVRFLLGEKVTKW